MTTPLQKQVGPKPAPIEKFSIGRIQASIWKNEAESGTFYKAVLENSFKDGDVWKTTSSYGSRDLINLAKCALQAHSSILKLQRVQEVGSEANEDIETE